MVQDESADSRALSREIMDALPDWVNTMIYLNGLIAARMNVVPSDFQCLHVIVHDGPITAGHIAARVSLTPGSISRAIDRLEAAKAARRIPDPSDRRRMLVEATNDGMAAITNYYQGLTIRTEDDLSTFSDDELAAVLRFIGASRNSAVVEAKRLRGQS